MLCGVFFVCQFLGVFSLLFCPPQSIFYFSLFFFSVLNTLGLFLIYMVVLSGPNGKQSHVVLGIFLTRSEK